VQLRKYFWVLLGLFFFTGNVFAEQVVVEREVRALPQSEREPLKKFGVDTFYEYSWIKQAGRHILWKTGLMHLSYNMDGLSPYVEVLSYDRDHLKDETIELGAYGKWKDGVVHAALGYGTQDADFVYKFQAALGYEHRLIKNLTWKVDYRFVDYKVNDANIISPGLVYYFGNSYGVLEYGSSLIEKRGLAQWGALKANFYLNRLLDFSLGTAVGERLYDIADTLSAGEEYGYIFFCGLRFKMGDDKSFRIGYSYAKEKPSFLKRGVDLTFSLKF